MRIHSTTRSSRRAALPLPREGGLQLRQRTFASIVPADWRVQHEQLSELSNRIIVRAASDSSVSAIATASTPCAGLMLSEADLEYPAPRETMAAAVGNAHGIFVGRVDTVTPGFFFGTPGTLISLRDIITVKSDATYRPDGGHLYVRHPYAQFTSGHTTFCRENQPGSYVPAIGDRVMVFAYRPPVSDSTSFVYTTNQDLVIEPTRLTAQYNCSVPENSGLSASLINISPGSGWLGPVRPSATVQPSIDQWAAACSAYGTGFPSMCFDCSAVASRSLRP